MSEVNYKELAEQFNEKMGLSEPDDYWEDALVRFSVIAEEVGELFEAINKGRDEEIPEELADVVITCYTGADTLDVELPEGGIDVQKPSGAFDEELREEASEIYKAVSKVYTAICMGNRDSVATELHRVVFYCHRAALVYDVDLEEEYREKMEYNMQKSGEKVNGKPVDDVE